MKVFVDPLRNNLVVVAAGVDVVAQSQQRSAVRMVVVGDQGIIVDELNCGSKARD